VEEWITVGDATHPLFNQRFLVAYRRGRSVFVRHSADVILRIPKTALVGWERPGDRTKLTPEAVAEFIDLVERLS